jgi:PAS domain-containing protein
MLVVLTLLAAYAVYTLRKQTVIPTAFKIVFERLNDLLVVVDSQQHILMMNPAAERAFQRPLKDVVGQPLGNLWPDHKVGIHRPASGRTIKSVSTARHMIRPNGLKPAFGIASIPCAFRTSTPSMKGTA